MYRRPQTTEKSTMSKEAKARIAFTAAAIITGLLFGLLTAGCGSIEEVPADDANTTTTPDSGKGGTPVSMTGTGGTMNPLPADGAVVPPADGNSGDGNDMLTTEEIIAKLKVVPPQVVFVIGNPNDFGGAKYGYEIWNFPIGQTCVNPTNGNTAMIWRDGKWQKSSYLDKGVIVSKPVKVERIATSDELSTDKVVMENPETPRFAPLTIDLWKITHKKTMEADITKINASLPSPLDCRE